MNGFLIDTNVISEIRKGTRCHPGVSLWFEGTASQDLFLSVLVVGELRHGVELVRQRGDRTAAEKLGLWLRRLTGTYGDRILPVTKAIAELWGEFGLEQPVPPIDGLLAATAVYHDLTLVTRNVGNVRGTPAVVVNPFG